MVDYRFPTKILNMESVRGPAIEMEPAQVEARRRIVNRYISSFAEYLFALAIVYMKLRFAYKYTIPGTRYHVDFFIQSGPRWDMVDVQKFRSGMDTSQQAFRKRVIERIMGRPLITVWDTEFSTFEEAVGVLRRIVA